MIIKLDGYLTRKKDNKLMQILNTELNDSDIEELAINKFPIPIHYNMDDFEIKEVQINSVSDLS